ncbi:hypothetical protein BDW66DRAFT_141911 [Aspergillus desertorum]
MISGISNRQLTTYTQLRANLRRIFGFDVDMFVHAASCSVPCPTKKRCLRKEMMLVCEEDVVGDGVLRGYYDVYLLEILINAIHRRGVDNLHSLTAVSNNAGAPGEGGLSTLTQAG